MADETKKTEGERESIEDWRARVDKALIEHQIIQPLGPAGAQAQTVPELDWNGFQTAAPGPADFLYARRDNDNNPALVHVHVDEQPPEPGDDEDSQRAYQNWRKKALPLQPPLDFSQGPMQQGAHSGDWTQALKYAYESQTGYPPPNPPEGEGSTISGGGGLGGGLGG